MDMTSTLVQEMPTVLVVDDDSTNVLVLESMLKREGYKTLQAHDGQQAIDVAKAHQPDLILLDIMMPEVDGFQACRCLQQESLTTDIPVIFLSALDDVECKVKAFDIGAVDYVGKPFQKAEVLARVRLHLKLNMSKRAAIAAQTDKLKQLQDAQQAILVSPQDLPAAQFAVSYSPLQEAGGDFYDVLPISDQIFGYFVADISGHDLGASFTTPAIKVLLAQHATPLFTAVETMKNVNGVLSTVMTGGNHITACYARLNRTIGQLEVISGGHPPLIFQPQQGDIEILETQGDVLGVFESVCFDPVERSVRPGDRFFMYSDGLIERFYREQIKRQEGLEQLSQAIAQTAQYPIQEAVNRIYQEILPADAAQVLQIKESEIFQLTDELQSSATAPEAEPEPVDIVPPPAGWEQSDVETIASEISEPQDTASSVEVQEDVPAEPETPVTPSPRPAPKARTAPSKAPSGDTTLRVNVKLLDNLMNLAGELVLSRNELIQAAGSADQNQIGSATQRINLVTSELQEAIMLTRMQPVGNIFNKFPRVVRDLASMLDKKIELSVSGKEVELDKTIIEGLADPLTHLVRNSADHGIEDPDVRRKAGKSETGQIWLKAYHEAGQVNIEISDDGKGIDPEKLAESAIKKELVTAKQVEAMSDKEKVALIFMPGFSMAAKVTDVSGRGVGMDVVKTNLDQLGGQVDIDSKVGKGTTIRIKLPLTLAIIPSLMISSEHQRYALPMVNVVELLRIPAKQIKERIEKVGEAEVVRLRSELLPIISLKQLLADESKPLNAVAESQQVNECVTDPVRAMNIVVVSAGSFKYGLIVDELHDSEEIVVKPLDQHLKKCQGYAGATIMGNGQVALILDVASLARMADLNTEELNKGTVESTLESGSIEETTSLLIFGCSETEKFGVPVDLVGRIERIEATAIEYSGGRQVIKYRGGILPVHAINEVANVEGLAARKELLVIVFNIEGHEFGLLAISPIDTVDVALVLDRETLRQTGIHGSAIINDQTTLIVDIFEFIQTLHPEWFEAPIEEEYYDDLSALPTPIAAGSKILYAEDSGFFRSTVKGLLEEEGYEVIAAEDGIQAWELLQQHAAEISMVLTDVEMPNLDGIGLARKIKTDERFQHIPIVALTTLAGDKDVAKGKEAGVTEYQVKLDKDKLLQSIHGFMD